LKQQQKITDKQENTIRLHYAMMLWWKSFGNNKCCQQCNIKLPKYFSSSLVHHLLPKNKYNDIKFEEKFWMLLCDDCHFKWENFMNGKIVKEKTSLAKKDYLNNY
jgi:hypothetical protein